MGSRDLGLRTVIESVLDAQGFDEFKKRVAEAGRQAGSGGQSASEAGKHFDRLGKQLPHASFKILADEMLESAGVMGHTRVLSNLLEEAMMGVGAATKATATVMAGATLGIGLLIPLLLSMRKETDNVSEATKDVTQVSDSWLDQLENIRKKTGALTAENEKLYEALVAVKKEQTEGELRKTTIAIDALTKKYHEQALAYIETNRLVGAQAQQFLMLADAAAAVDPKLVAMKEQEQQLRGEVDGTRQSLQKQSDAADDLAESTKKASGELERLKRQQEEWHAWAVEEVGKQFQAMNDQEARAQAIATKRQKEQFLDRQKMIHDGEAKNKAQAEAATREYVKNKREEATAARDAEQQKQDAMFTTMDMASSFLRTAFGNSKAAAIASVIINTAEAIMKEEAQLGVWALPAQIATAALGAAQIAKISGQDAGFDDPVNDSIVEGAFRKFGRGWATDMTQLAARGALRGFGEGLHGGGSVTNNNSSRTTVNRGTHIGVANFNSLLGTPGQARAAFERRRIRIARKEDRTRRRSL